MADLTDVRFGPGGTIRHQAPTIYTRARWGDAWTLDDSLELSELSWSCMPTLPTATMILHYGKVRWWNDERFAVREKRRNMARRYVKIVAPMQREEDGTFVEKTWYGVFEVTIDEQQGIVVETDVTGEQTTIGNGEQQLVAYGLESLLQSHLVRGARFEYGGGTIDGDATIPFNRRGRGNRSTAKVDGAYVFTDDIASAPNWSTQDVVEYLLANHTPRDSTNTVLVPFRIAADAWLPNWDDPQLDPAEQTTLGLIGRLASRQRLISAWWSVHEGDDVVELKTNTIVRAAVTVSIPGAVDAQTPACTRQLRVISDDDQATKLAVKDSDLPLYDAVVTLGARETSVGTFSFPDETIDRNWTASEEVEYIQGATLSPNYAASNVRTKQKANAAARSSPRMERVYAHFAIPRTWDQRCGDGVGGPKRPMFPMLSGGVVTAYWPTTFVEHALPLYAGADYTGNKIEDGTYDEFGDLLERLPVLVFMASPDDGRAMRVEQIGNAADLEIETAGKFGQFSVHAHVPHESHGFVLRVAGAPQHAIAHSDFTRLAEDPDAGSWDFRLGMVATLAMQSGRRLQGRYPETDTPGVDCLRTYYLDLGDAFEAVYVVPETVLGVDVEGALKRSKGGWIYRPANAPQRLAALAKIAASWYTRRRYAVTIDTQRLTTEIGLGDLIARIGSDVGDNPHQLDCDAPVTEIRVAWPLSEGGSPESPTMTIQTFAGELDPIQITPRDETFRDALAVPEPKR